ncbi:MAG: Octaprenyl-diphosphate synthase [Candidatus Ordinivivax streblomastigis]|uniref:Octaprenyl-diphosphate synthase n=1 Tax=Candidatus Ordinivivax streblomastigis TaxID=2540710 RepID=A0A5M8P1U4_9BACT|nr:MAG: Octaprenyl-diphosphate synthase [Candidatus Ordinivivax streblomastigis]
MELSCITQPIQKELEDFDELYKKSLYRPGKDFQFMLDFVANKNGKRIRPLIVILAAKLCGEPNQNTLQYAIILELLHIATLIHDDVVDNTLERRGQPSVMAQFDNRAAVLLGDYILSQAISHGVETKNLKIIKIMASLAQFLSEGELTQLVSSSELIIGEQRYFEVIWKKTAVLFASCTELGAISAKADAEKIKILQSIGKNLGICFQLRDDIFDYFEQGELGKPTGNDIREGKITLPLIHALRTAPKEKANKIIAIIQQQDFSSETIQKCILFAKEYNGIEYAVAKMQEIKTNTIGLLSGFPDSEVKKSMIGLIDYIIERRK